MEGVTEEFLWKGKGNYFCTIFVTKNNDNEPRMSLEQQLIDLAYNKREYDLQKVLNDYVDYHYIDNYFLGVNPGCWLLTVNGVVVPQDKYKSVEDLANPANSPIGSEVIMYSLKK